MHSSHVAPRSCTERERPPAGTVPFHITGGDRSQSGTTRASGKLARFATSRDTTSVVVLALRSRESRLCVGGQSSHVAPRSCAERERPPVGAVPFHIARADLSERGTARALGKLACSATFRDTASAAVLARRSRESRLCAGSHNSHVAPQSRTEGEGLPPVPRPSMSRRPITTSAIRRTRGKRACFATSRETANSVARSLVPREHRLRVGGHSLHAAPRSCTEGESPFAGAAPFHVA